MAYHYAINTANGETRRIMSSSLGTYQNAAGWKVFDTEEERNAFAGVPWHVVNYSNRYRPVLMSGVQARTYWTENHLRAGWAFFQTMHEAQAALNAMQERWSFNPETGKSLRVQNWLPVELRTPQPGYVGEFESLDAAIAAYPPTLCALHPDSGRDRKIYPGQRLAHIEDGYIVDETIQACRARLPVRWLYDHGEGKYIRQTSGVAMMRPSRFAQLRGALRALKEGSSVFRVARRDYYTKSVLMEANSATVWRDETATARDFVARINAMTGEFSLTLCHDCGDTFCSHIFSTSHEGNLICEDCRENYVTCGNCGCAMTRENAMQDGRGRYLCETHWALSDRGITGELQEYNADVTRYKKGFLTVTGEKSRALWMGWELEVHAKGDSGGNGHDPECELCGGSGTYRDDDDDPCDCDCEGPGNTDLTGAIRKVQEQAGGWSITKSDGSVNNGFEIVSVPASLAWHTANVKPWLEKAQHYLSGWPHNDCGIHVHVGIDQLSPLTQGKLLTFMHDPANQAFITTIAGRDTNTYCLRGETKKKIPDYRREYDHGRYQALNFSTRGKKTVEFRIFRSNVSPAGFMKNLEFVHALCVWARLTSMQDVCNTQRGIKKARVTKATENFIAWVQKERAQYPHLVRWFEANGFLPKPRVHPDLNLAETSIAA
jgi:hypothetical protein